MQHLQQAVSPCVPDNLLVLYPYLKMTNTGALVLWNFLWALLQDNSYRHVAV